MLSLKQSAVCDDMAKAEWILNYTIDMFMSATMIEKDKHIHELQDKIAEFERKAEGETLRMEEVTATLKAKESVIAELVDKLTAADEASSETLAQAARLV